MSRETFNYDGLLLDNDVCEITVTVAASQTIARGDLLVAAATSGVPANAFSKDSVGGKTGNVYAVAAEAITTGASDTTKTIVAYIKGKFDKSKVTAQAAVGNELALAAQGIVLVATHAN